MNACSSRTPHLAYLLMPLPLVCMLERCCARFRQSKYAPVLGVMHSQRHRSASSTRSKVILIARPRRPQYIAPKERAALFGLEDRFSGPVVALPDRQSDQVVQSICNLTKQRHGFWSLASKRSYIISYVFWGVGKVSGRLWEHAPATSLIFAQCCCEIERATSHLKLLFDVIKKVSTKEQGLTFLSQVLVTLMRRPFKV